MVDSPLKVSVRMPWSTGTQDTIVASVSLQFLDENNVLPSLAAPEHGSPRG